MKNTLDLMLFGKFEQLTYSDILSIANHPELFGLNRDLQGLIKKKASLADMIVSIKNYCQPCYEILKRTDGCSINETNLQVRFKEDLFANLNKMTVFQFCVFLDYLSYYMTRVHGSYRFFGQSFQSVEAYHEINTIISSYYGCDLTFEIFSMRNSLKFVLLPDVDTVSPITRFKTGPIIECLERRLIHYHWLAHRISECTLREISKEKFHKVNGNMRKFSIAKLINSEAKDLIDIKSLGDRELNKKKFNEDNKNISDRKWTVVLDNEEEDYL